nr:MAG TPA: hypothetical protein [Caudoviricetes sp.]
MTIKERVLPGCKNQSRGGQSVKPAQNPQNN